MESAVSSPNFAGDRTEIGGYRVVRSLSAESWLAVMPGGRHVVLKILDEDGLWNGKLHPNIRDRLGRVRELAHSGVANLYGVERDEGMTYLVWEFIEGETLDCWAASPACGQRDLLRVSREWVLSVEMLHSRGLVHGRLSASNVIVDGAGRLVLTHISPLLYNDPAQDVSDLIGALMHLLEGRGELDSPLGELLGQALEEGVTFRRLAARIAALIESREAEPREDEDSDREVSQRIRRRAVVGAGATAALGIFIFFGLKQYAAARSPKPPVPPQAAPAAFAAPSRGEDPSASAAPWSWSKRATP